MKPILCRGLSVKKGSLFYSVSVCVGMAGVAAGLSTAVCVGMAGVAAGLSMAVCVGMAGVAEVVSVLGLLVRLQV